MSRPTWESITNATAEDSSASSVPTWARGEEASEMTSASVVSDDPTWLVDDAEARDEEDAVADAAVGTVPTAAEGDWMEIMDDGANVQRRRRKRLLLILTALALLLALILGVVLGIRGNNDNGGDTTARGTLSDGDTPTIVNGTTLPPASIPIDGSPTPAPTDLAPSSSPSKGPPTLFPTTAPPTLFPTFQGFTPAPTEVTILESLHSVEWGSSVSNCAYGTPLLTLTCSNGGQVIVEDSPQVDCTSQSSSVLVCTATSSQGGVAEVVFRCRGVNANQLTGTVSIPGGTASQCDGQVSTGLFSVTNGGEALHFILLQRFCLADGEDDLAPFGGYSCLKGQTGENVVGESVCFSSDDCEETSRCFPFFPFFCGDPSCDVPLSPVEVSDPDSRTECVFSWFVR